MTYYESKSPKAKEGRGEVATTVDVYFSGSLLMR